MTNSLTAGKILTNALKKIQSHNPKFSVRAAALKLGISVPFLSRILNNKRPFPESRLKEFSKIFQLDEIMQEQLKRSLLLKAVEGSASAKSVLKQMQKSKKSDADSSDDFVLPGNRDFDILNHWYYIALLDFISCNDFKNDSQYIAKRLGITVAEVDLAMKNLFAKGLLENVDGNLRKTNKKIRFSTRNSMAQVRAYHSQLIKKGVNHLLNNNRQEDFDARLIAGVTFTADVSKLPEAKEILNRALYDIAELMADGECTEVYQMSSLLFPLTKR